MKKFSAWLGALVLCLLMVIGAAAAETVVYVNDGGTGDGSSESAPLGSLVEAIDKVANGGKIVITDTYTANDVFYEPTHKGDIVITGGTLDLAGNPRNRYYLGGPGATTFENMTLKDGAGVGFAIIAQFNKVVMGEGLTTPADKAYVVGGYQTPFDEDIKLDLDSEVIVKSGTFRVVCGSSRGASSTIFTGTSHITVEGGNINMLLGGSCNGSAMGNAEITVNGGSISQIMMAGDATRRINGDATLTVNGGIIGQLRVNNIMGHATVNYNGGNIAQAEKSIEDKITEFVTDGTATLNVAANLNSALLALVFDTVNYVGGSAAATTAPVVTTEATSETTTAAETEQSEAPVASESSDVSAAVTEPAVTTEKQEETTKATEKTEKTDATSATAPAATDKAPASEGGLGVGAIVGIVLAVLVVVAVVVVIIVKKKK